MSVTAHLDYPKSSPPLLASSSCLMLLSQIMFFLGQNSPMRSHLPESEAEVPCHSWPPGPPAPPPPPLLSLFLSAPWLSLHPVGSSPGVSRLAPASPGSFLKTSHFQWVLPQPPCPTCIPHTRVLFPALFFSLALITIDVCTFLFLSLVISSPLFHQDTTLTKAAMFVCLVCGCNSRALEHCLADRRALFLMNGSMKLE